MGVLPYCTYIIQKYSFQTIFQRFAVCIYWDLGAKISQGCVIFLLQDREFWRKIGFKQKKDTAVGVLGGKIMTDTAAVSLHKTSCRYENTHLWDIHVALFLTEFFEIFSGFQKSQNQSVVNAFLCKNMLPTYREVGISFISPQI